MHTISPTTIASTLLVATVIAFATHAIWNHRARTLAKRTNRKEYPRHPDLIVDLKGFPGDKSPDINQFYAKVSHVLASTGIKWCLAGDQAWEYYNVPFVITEQHIVVPHSQVEHAIDLFSAMPDFCVPFRPRHYDTPPFRNFQRFKLTGVVLYFLIIPDTFYSLSPLSEDKFVSPQPAPFPVLYLKYYVDGLGRLGVGQIGGGQYRVVLEYLVDSMDLDQAWCSRNLDPASPAWQIVLDFAQLKQARLGNHPKYHGNITALIQNKSQLEAALRIPGRDLPIAVHTGLKVPVPSATVSIQS